MENNEPFLKWAGGKRWLVSQHHRLFPYVFGRYVEPFLGGGAVFFYLQPQKAILSDKNEELVNVYRTLRENPNGLQRLLQVYQAKHSEEFYYRWRKRKQTNPLHRAARFLYLNRVCFNGLFRVNLRGEFNVPIGTKTQVTYPRGYLSSVSKLLKRAQIVQSDFEDIIDQTTVGDFVYVDPPYTVMHNNNNFLKYNDVLFSWADQVRLAAAVRRATRRGALILVSNADHDSIRQLYYGYGYVDTLTRASILSGDTTARRRTSEVALRNYLI
jgi:DNA adenine methylase